MMKANTPIPVTVIIVTLKRPDCLRLCLQALQSQSVRPDQVIVADASRDDLSRLVIEQFPEVLYLSVAYLNRNQTASRNAALPYATGEIIAFLDDDAYAHPDWLQNLVAAYDSPSIGGVGGRALNNQAGEAERGRDEIGLLKANGFLTGNFAADPGGPVNVDHLIGCNMSFRRKVFARMGGFREEFPGVSGICEETDLCLRVKALGYTLRYEPSACVDHAGAPQSKGQRFDARYQFFHRRNSFVMLIRNFGFAAVVWRFPFAIVFQTGLEFARSVGGALLRAVASLVGLFAGLYIGSLLWIRKGSDPIRRDSTAQLLRAALEARNSQPTRPAEPLARARH